MLLGTLYAWGANHLGQAGAGPGEDRLAPAPVAGLAPVHAVCCNPSGAVLALDGDGRVWSWGWNEHGMLGRGAQPEGTQPILLPTSLRKRGHRMLAPDPEDPAAFVLQGACPPAPIPGLPPIVQIALGSENGYALDAHGVLWAWGAGICTGHPWPKHQIQTPVQWEPLRVPGLPALRSVHIHPEGSAAYAIDTTGQAWSWGNGYEGELGHGKRRNDATPGPVARMSAVRCLAAGSFCALAVQEDGSAWGWGNAQDGVGFLPPTKRTVRVLEPVPVQDMGAAVQQAWMGGHLAIYRTVDGAVHGAGIGLLDLLARHAEGADDAVHRLPELDRFQHFFLGGGHGFGVDPQGRAHGFGRVECGALGNGESDEDLHRQAVPLALPGPVLAMAVAGYSSFALCGLE